MSHLLSFLSEECPTSVISTEGMSRYCHFDRGEAEWRNLFVNDDKGIASRISRLRSLTLPSLEMTKDGIVISPDTCPVPCHFDRASSFVISTEACSVSCHFDRAKRVEKSFSQRIYPSNTAISAMNSGLVIVEIRIPSRANVSPTL